MKKLLGFALVSYLGVFPNTAQAASISGLVSSIYVNAGGGVSVTMTGTPIGTSPSCATSGNGGTVYYLDASTIYGQGTLHAFYAAKLTGSTVSINGGGSCLNGITQENVGAAIF